MKIDSARQNSHSQQQDSKAWLSLFSIPKAMEGHIGLIQKNAFASWQKLEGVKVFLLGQDAGVAEAAAEFGFEHLNNIACNEHGTPLVSSILGEACQASPTEHLTYVNADILLGQDFVETVRSCLRQVSGLLVGHRWNLDISESLDFTDPQLHSQLAADARAQGSCGGPYAIDYFVFHKSVFGTVPEFAIGRHHWDNWLLFRARQRNYPIVDLSTQVTAVHQNHGYGQSGTVSDQEFRQSPEVLRNKKLSGGRHYGLDLRHATHEFVTDKIESKTGSALIRLQRSLPRFRLLFWLYNLGLCCAEDLIPESLKARLRKPLQLDV